MPRLKKKPLLVLFFFHFFLCSNAYKNVEPYSEAGLFVGTSYYLGDLNKIHFPITLLKPGGGIFYRYNLNGHYSLRPFVNFGTVQGSDALSEDRYLKNRNLSFKSVIVETGFALEFNFYDFALYKDIKRVATPFVHGGINYFYFNPKGYSSGTWVNLQPLGTEGQGTTANPNKKYFLHQIALPVGIGVKVKYRRFAASVEWGIRKTFTDYIDDVSTTYADPNTLSPLARSFANKSTASSQAIVNKQRGNSKTKDWYVFSGITLSFKLGKEKICRVY